MGITHRKQSRAAKQLAAMNAELRERTRLRDEIEQLTHDLAEARETIDQNEREILELRRELKESTTQTGPISVPVNWSVNR